MWPFQSSGSVTSGPSASSSYGPTTGTSRSGRGPSSPTTGIGRSGTGPEPPGPRRQRLASAPRGGVVAAPQEMGPHRLVVRQRGGPLVTGPRLVGAACPGEQVGARRPVRLEPLDGTRRERVERGQAGRGAVEAPDDRGQG